MKYTIEQLSEVAEEIISVGRRRRPTDHATIITFSGDLGAGKTTLIKELAKQLGITESLHSPTFVIYKRYELPLSFIGVRGSGGEVGAAPSPWGRAGVGIWKNLIHADMYRLESSAEIQKLGWQELIDNPENIICIEWPEKIADAIPNWAIRITINHDSDQTREIIFHEPSKTL
jgi:tRNA threonylcarbamoyladenosine biosynthesis protein TsaE